MKTKWYVRKTEFTDKSPNNTDIGPYDDYGDAYRELGCIARDIHRPVSTDEKGGHIVNGDNCLYWIYGESIFTTTHNSIFK